MSNGSNSTLRKGLARLYVSDTDRHPNLGILSAMAMLRHLTRHCCSLGVGL